MNQPQTITFEVRRFSENGRPATHVNDANQFIRQYRGQNVTVKVATLGTGSGFADYLEEAGFAVIREQRLGIQS